MVLLLMLLLVPGFLLKGTNSGCGCSGRSESCSEMRSWIRVVMTVVLMMMVVMMVMRRSERTAAAVLLKMAVLVIPAGR